jgi:hypothetical protein
MDRQSNYYRESAREDSERESHGNIFRRKSIRGMNSMRVNSPTFKKESNQIMQNQVIQNKPDFPGTNSSIKKSLIGKSGRMKLSEKVKEVNERFINSLEAQYSQSNKYSPIALKLAEVYIKGKRVSQNLSRAVEILSTSVLAEAKFMLVELAFNNREFEDVFHYLEFFTSSK